MPARSIWPRASSALIKGLPGGVLVLDSGGEIQECNPAARELLGEPLLAQSFAAVLERSKTSAGLAGEHTELRSGRFVNISRRELQSGGEVVLLTDVTEAHLMQVFLTRQQRLLTLGELAAGLAHQIRTPLAAALLYASQMTLPGRSPETQGALRGANRQQPQTARQARERHAGLRARRRRARSGERERAAWNRWRSGCGRRCATAFASPSAPRRRI